MRMQKGFWDQLDGPIVGLSPMDGVTDASMRFVAKKYGQADIIYTEFVSADGLWRLKKKGEMDNKIWKDLIYDESQRPVIAQLFGSDPDSFYEATRIVCDMGFDGVDINMGCPSPGLEKRGGGAGLMRDKGRAAAVIEATRLGAEDFFGSVRAAPKPYSDLPLKRVPASVRLLAGAPAPNAKKSIPVSVKTRIGSAEPDESWWKFLAGMKLPAVAMHGRTFKQLYKGEADWEVLLKAGEIIRESGAKFLPNGDVKGIRSQIGLVVELKIGKEVDLTGKADGVLIGREAIGNPWVLKKDGYTPTIEEKLMVAVEQSRKYEEFFNGRYDSSNFQFFPMRKHLACYARGFEGSSSLRKRLMMAENSEQVETLVEEFLRDG